MSSSELKPASFTQPLINSIPSELLPRFDPVFVKYHNHYSAGRIATHQIPIEDYRADPIKYTTAYGRAIANDVGRITEQVCPVYGGEIKIRIFEPIAGSSSSGGSKPVYINFHGGGWVFGGLQVDHEFCKRVVDATGCVAFDVDYRLSPEYKFPIPVDDCWAAFNWVRDHKQQEFNLDLNRVAIGGVSAGGHLSAVIALMCREAGIPLALQILSVPVCDMDQFSSEGLLKPECPYESYREMYDTVPLPTKRMEYFSRHFLGNPRPKELYNNWKVSPMKASDFSNLAPAVVITAEMDPLRDEGEAYAEKLKAAGTSVEHTMVKGVPHTFMMMDDILEGGVLYNRITTTTLAKAFGIELKESSA